MAKRKNLELIPPEELMTFWDILTPDERQFLKSSLVVQHYNKNDIIHAEGEVPAYMMVLASGKVKVYKDGVGSRAQIIRMLKPSEHFGYRAIISNQKYNTTVSAFEPSTVYALRSDLFIAILKHNNAFCYRFLEEIAEDLGASDARTINLTQKHIRGRLAESLLILRKNYGFEADGATINIYLSREDLANFSNMTASNAIRTLSNFVSEHVIAMDGRRLKILDEEKLFKISKTG